MPDPLKPDYTDKVKVKVYLEGLTGITEYDTLLDTICPEASRFVDGYCGRSFGVTLAGVTRTYDGDGDTCLLIHDAVAVTAVTVDGVAREFYAYPSNKDSDRPYLWLEAKRGYRFSRGQQNVIVTGTWGWPAIPDAVRHVSTSLAIRALRSTQAGFSDVVGTTETGAPVFSKFLTQADVVRLNMLKRTVQPQS